MAGVKTKNTAPERQVQNALKKLKVKYRSNDKRLPGKPDIVLMNGKTVIFVHGCFWHQHKSCRAASRPTTRIGFWNDKLNDNIRRDRSNVRRLKRLGFKVLIIWECWLNKSEKWEKKIFDFLNF